MSSDLPRTARKRHALHPEPMPRVELFLSLIRAHDAQVSRATKLLHDFGVTHQQYNVLRILYVRDEDGEGVSCSNIGKRLLTRVPDITRLLDRLAKLDLIERYRCQGDRRVVRARLTEAGYELVERIDEPLIQLHGELSADLSDEDVQTGIRLLTKLQRAADADAP